MNKTPPDPAILAGRLGEAQSHAEPPWDPPACGEIDMRIARLLSGHAGREVPDHG
jgi:hypothetical protein